MSTNSSRANARRRTVRRRRDARQSRAGGRDSLSLSERGASTRQRLVDDAVDALASLLQAAEDAAEDGADDDDGVTLDGAIDGARSTLVALADNPDLWIPIVGRVAAAADAPPPCAIRARRRASPSTPTPQARPRSHRVRRWERISEEDRARALVAESRGPRARVYDIVEEDRLVPNASVPKPVPTPSSPLASPARRAREASSTRHPRARPRARLARVGDDAIASRRHLGARGCALVVGFRRRRRRLRTRWRPRARAGTSSTDGTAGRAPRSTRRAVSPAGRPIEARGAAAAGRRRRTEATRRRRAARRRFRAPNARQRKTRDC